MAEARTLAQRHVANFNDRRWDDTSIYAPDIEVVDPSGTVRGIEGFVAHGQGFAAAFPDSTMMITEVVESGSTAVIEGLYRGTHTGTLQAPQGPVPPTGRILELPIVLAMRVEAGKITSNHAYFDQMTFAAQLGLLGAPEEAQ